MKKWILLAATIATTGCPANNKVVDGPGTCELDGETVFEGDPCTCDFGSPDGEISCDPTPSCTTCENFGDAGFDVGSPADTGSDSGSTDTGTDSGTDAGADLGPDAGMPRHRGSCTTSADCSQPTWECITIPANDPLGYHTCQPATAAEPGCGTIEDPDTCCLHTDCNQTDANALCVTGPIFYCGGVAPIFANVCVTDECAADSDCGAGQICLPPRVLAEPVARCVDTQCTYDSDCTGGTGGECRPFFNPCNGRFTGFACTYDDSECRSSDECTDGNRTYCLPGTGDGDTSCQEFFPPP